MFTPAIPAQLSAADSPRATARNWFALIVLMLPVLLVAVDNTVLSFAIPEISVSLSPSAPELLWIVDVYPLVLAGLLVSMGSFADRIGRRRLLLIGGAGFTLVSILAAFAPNAAWLIAARALLGFFGAMLMPATLSLIRNIFLDPRQRRSAIAIWAAGFSGGAALGPIVGGFLLEHFWWGSVFLLAVPVLIPLLVFGPVFIPESRDPRPGRIDPISIVLSFTAMVPLVFGIKSFATEGFGLASLLPACLGLLSGWLFVRRQLSRKDPMLEVQLFKNPVFTGAVLANLLSIFSLVGFLFFISQHLQLVSGLTAPQAGLALLPGLAVTVLAGLLVVPLARLVKPVYLVAGGLLLNAAGYALVAVFNPPSVAVLLMAFAVLGAGIGGAETISNDLILSSAPVEKAGAASAISETAYELGSVLGTAILGSILAGVYREQLQLPTGLGAEAAAKAQGTLGGALEIAGKLGDDAATTLRDSAMAAFDHGAAVIAVVGVVLMLTAALLSVLTLRRAKVG